MNFIVIQVHLYSKWIVRNCTHSNCLPKALLYRSHYETNIYIENKISGQVWASEPKHWNGNFARFDRMLCNVISLLLVQYTLFHTVDASVDQSNTKVLGGRICIERSNDFATQSDRNTIAVSYRPLRATDQRQTEYLDDPDTYSDTLSTSDAVTRQYLSLPYPSVSEEHLQAEKNHYLGPDRNDPHTTYTSLSLEYLNHFLYEGKNDFR